MERVTITADGNNVLIYRLTPWDSRVFECRTAEILELKFTDDDHGRQLIRQFLDDADPELCYGRFRADDIRIKKLLLKYGFFPAETQAKLHVPSLSSYQLPALHQRRLLPLEEGSDADRREIARQAPTLFRFSRFHEDPFISAGDAGKRMGQWASQLADEQKPLLVYRSSDTLTSFVYYQMNDEVVTLTLGGSMEGKGMITPYFFGSVIDHFQKKGLKTLNGVDVSVANTGIFRVYLALNFELRETFTDYHWHRRET